MLQYEIIWMASLLFFLLYRIIDQTLLAKRLGTCLYPVKKSFGEMGGWIQLLRAFISLACGVFLVRYTHVSDLAFALFLIVYGRFCVAQIFPLLLLLKKQFGIYEYGVLTTGGVHLYLAIKYFTIAKKKNHASLVFLLKRRRFQMSTSLPIEDKDARQLKRLLQKACKYAEIKPQEQQTPRRRLFERAAK